jgi:hypothetical protein
MKYFWKTIPVIILLLLTGCKTATLLMKVDPALETNASVYEVLSPEGWSDKELNVSFGAYRVEDVDTGWVTTRKSSDRESFWANMLYEATGISTISPDDITGDTADDTRSEETSEVFQSLSYKFKIGNGITWDSQCDHFAEKQETVYKKVTSLKILSSYYTCWYTRSGGEQWVLSIERLGPSQLDIRMAGREKIFRARSTEGTYVLSDGSPYETFGPPDMGYTWTHDNNNVAAISVKEKNPRVWLDKRNSDATNHVLSMASAGLLIYQWKIAPTLQNSPVGR